MYYILNKINMTERDIKWVALPCDLWLHIAKFVIPICYKFDDWIDATKIRKEHISQHPKAVEFLLANPDRGKLRYLIKNANPRVQKILWTQYDNISWTELSTNCGSWVYSFMKDILSDPVLNYQKLKHISRNTNPKFIEYLSTHINLINGYELSN